MLRRSFLKIAVAATAALTAAKLPAGDAGPVRIGYAWLIMKDDVTGEARQADWSRTPVRCNEQNWQEVLQAGAQIQINRIDFGRVREAGMYTAIKLELDYPQGDKAVLSIDLSVRL